MLGRVISQLVEDSIRFVGGGLGRQLRYIYYRSRLGSCGAGVVIDEGVYFHSKKNIFLGDNIWLDKGVIIIAGKINQPNNVKYVSRDEFEGDVRIGSNSHVGISTVIQGHGGVRIGEFFTSSAGCKIYSLSNDYKKCMYGTVKSSKNQVYYISSSIDIGRNVWLGLNVSVMGGEIGDNVFVHSNLVSYKNIVNNSVVVNITDSEHKKRF